MATTKEAKPNRGVKASQQILKHLGDLLKKSRTANEETLDAAAKVLGFDGQASNDTKGSAKANLSNIENGKIVLPWRRLVKFSGYTRQNAATVMVLLAAARALREIDDPEEQGRLETDIKAIFALHPEANLTTLTDRLGVQPSVTAARQLLRSQYPAGLWRDFLHLDRICPRLASYPGTYFDIDAEAAFFADGKEMGTVGTTHRKLLVVHGKTISGGELVLARYLRRMEYVIPVGVNASEIAGSSSSNPIDLARILRTELAAFELGVNPESLLDAPGLLVVFRALPSSIQELRRLHDATEQFFAAHPDARGFVLAEDHVPKEWLAELADQNADCFTLSPLRESDSLKVLRECCDIEPNRLTDWHLVAMRHPLLLAAMVTMFDREKTLPDRWGLIRAVARGLASGTFAADEDLPGFFQRATVDLENLARKAAEALPNASGAFHFDTQEENERIRRLYPFVTRDQKGEELSFALISIHCYFAVLHFMWSGARTRFSNFTRDVRDTLNQLRQAGDPVGAADLLEAIRSELSCHSSIPQKVIENTSRLTAEHHAASQLTLSAETQGPVCRKHDDLHILLEDQEPARALKRILNNPTIPGPDDFKVRLFPVDYDFIADHIRGMLANPQSADGLSFDIIACPHHVLAEALARAKRCVDITAQTGARLEHSIVARQYCRRDGVWYGVPFQYPTKFLCKRRSATVAQPIPFGNWSAFELFLTKSPLKLVLQAKPGHESLYYEWLAFCLAMGGGDILWSRNAPGGTIIIDSPHTVLATERFLSLIRNGICHRDSTKTDWDNLVPLLLEDESAGLALPFSDTVTELTRGDLTFDFSTFGPFADILPSPIVQPFGFESLPRHVLTAHVFVLLNHDSSVKERADKFFTWYLSDRIQERFLEESLHSVWADRFITTTRSAAIGADALRTAAVAQQYGFSPPHEESDMTASGNSSGVVLSRGQEIVLGEISDLVEGKSTKVQDALRNVAKILRRNVS